MIRGIPFVPWGRSNDTSRPRKVQGNLLGGGCSEIGVGGWHELLAEGWVTVDADDFAMQDGTAVAAVTFLADDRPTALGTAYLDYLAFGFHVSLLESSGATDDLGRVRCARSLFKGNHPRILAE